MNAGGSAADEIPAGLFGLYLSLPGNLIGAVAFECTFLAGRGRGNGARAGGGANRISLDRRDEMFYRQIKNV